jgi:hypothetical protein
MSQQINLYNPLFLKQEKHFSASALVRALGVVVAGIVAVSVFSWMQAKSAERLASQYRDQVARQRDQLVKFGDQAGAAARTKALEAEIAQLETEIKLRQATLQTLGTNELGNTAGFSEFFAALGRQAVPGIWLTHVQIGEAGNDLLVEGRALRAELMPRYLAALNRESMMRGRRVTAMKLTAASAPKAGEDGRFVEFSLNAPLELREAAAGERAR